MPDIVRLRYVGAHEAAVPVLGAGPGLGLLVQPGETVDVAGRVVEDNADSDGFVVEFGNPPQERVFPRSLWSTEAATKPAKAAKE